jgi:ribosomal-protein-alanine N-acetyltransferase
LHEADLSTPRLHAGRWAHFEPLGKTDLSLLWEAEKRAYSHPWSLGNFRDSVQSGHPAYLLVSPPLPEEAPLHLTASGHVLLGYWVVMHGVEEAHLLNIAVVPEYRRQAWARLMLDTLCRWVRTQGAHWVWLEVRASNAPAQALYRQQGFAPVGLRKQYYPAGPGQREDALVMSLSLKAWTHSPPAPLP